MKVTTPITKKNLKNHFNYSWYKYALVIILGCCLISLVYTVTAYRSPEDKRIDICFVSSLTNQENAEKIFKGMAQDIQFSSEVETVECTVIPLYDDGYSTEQTVMLRIAVGREADIVFMPEEYFLQYAQTGLFMPLDDLIGEGILDTGDADLLAGYLSVLEDDETNTYGDKHLYGIPLASFEKTYTLFGFEYPKGYMSIMQANGNEDNVILMAKAIMEMIKAD